MSVQSEINRINSAVNSAYDAVSDRGGTVPSSKKVANLAAAIASIPEAGGDYNVISIDNGDGTQDIQITDAEGGGSVTAVPLSVTANGTYDAPSGKAYSPVTVNVPSKAVQVANKVERVASSSYKSTTVSLTVGKTGTYTVQWCCGRSGTSGTYGSQLYIGNTAYGTAQTTWSGYTQAVTLNNVELTAGQTIFLKARSNSTSTQIYVAGLVIIEI